MGNSFSSPIESIADELVKVPAVSEALAPVAGHLIDNVGVSDYLPPGTPLTYVPDNLPLPIVPDKDCSHIGLIWDESCFSNPTNKANRISRCTNDLKAHADCKKWCIEENECKTTIRNYCNVLPIDIMANDPTCDKIKQDIIADKCSKDETLFITPICKTYCDNGNNCKASIQKYCTADNFSKYCQDYCSKDDNRRLSCFSAIKEYCKGDNIKEKWCKENLIKDVFLSDTGIINEIDKFCNNQGSQVQKDESVINIKKLEDLDTLENPICACYDKKLLDYKYSKVKDTKAKNLFISYPECLYSNCKDKDKAFQKSNNGVCDIKFCKNHFESDVIFEGNDIIKIDSNCVTGAGTGTGTETENKINFNKLLDKILNNKFNELQTEEIIFIVIVIVIILLLFFYIFSNDNSSNSIPYPYPYPYPISNK